MADHVVPASGEEIRHCKCYSPRSGSPAKLEATEYEWVRGDWRPQNIEKMLPKTLAADAASLPMDMTEEKWVKQPLDQQVARTVAIVKGMQMRDGVSLESEKSEGSEESLLVGQVVVCPRCREKGKVIRKFPHGKAQDAHLYVRHYDPKSQGPVDHHLMKGG